MLGQTEWTKVYEQRALEGTKIVHYVTPDVNLNCQWVESELVDVYGDMLTAVSRSGLDTPKMMCENIEEIYERMGW